MRNKPKLISPKIHSMWTNDSQRLVIWGGLRKIGSYADKRFYISNYDEISKSTVISWSKNSYHQQISLNTSKREGIFLFIFETSLKVLFLLSYFTTLISSDVWCFILKVNKKLILEAAMPGRNSIANFKRFDSFIHVHGSFDRLALTNIVIKLS